jgi:hypothetical protein
MKFFKIFFLFLASAVLSGCIQSTALLGPGITIASTGNIMQAGFQYGANTALKNETGKNTFEHLKDAVESKNEKKKFINEFTKIIEERFEATRKKLSVN